MAKQKEKKETKNESRLQHFIDLFNEKLVKIEKEGYSSRVKDNLETIIELRDGLYDAYEDPTCYDKDDIKHDILEFTKFIIRLNNVAQKHFNSKITMPSIEERLEEALKEDVNLKKIFK